VTVPGVAAGEAVRVSAVVLLAPGVSEADPEAGVTVIPDPDGGVAV
jgi:hypothetical protein